MTFPEKIDKLLKDNNIKSLRKLSEELDVPYTTLWDYYSNPIRLEKANMSYIRKIAKHLNCTVDYLAYDEVEDSSSTEPSERFSELDNALYSKMKELNDVEKKQYLV